LAATSQFSWQPGSLTRSPLPFYMATTWGPLFVTVAGDFFTRPKKNLRAVCFPLGGRRCDTAFELANNPLPRKEARVSTFSRRASDSWPLNLQAVPSRGKRQESARSSGGGLSWEGGGVYVCVEPGDPYTSPPRPMLQTVLQA